MKNKLQQLLDKTEWTEEERRWLLEYLEGTDANELKGLMFRQYHESVNQSEQINPALSKKLLGNIHERLGVGSSYKTPVRRMRFLSIAAASLIGLIVLTSYFLLKPGTRNDIAKTKSIQSVSKSTGKDVAPGGNKAVLTLADGSTILLDDARDGALAQQGSTKVLKQNGKLAYNTSKGGTAEVFFNTISTPRGGQYQVELPDGSRVWLNAASSLRFPTAFTGKERRVEISGEAYFEVAKNSHMPFIVKVQTAEVEVLGTHFNIMGYKEEAVLKTTLLEGSVRFVNNGLNTVLKPGQQSQLVKNGQVKIYTGVDVDEVVAWKNGLFHFESEEIETVMRQLSRWYDVEVVYENIKNDDLFYADIPRNTKLSDVLKALELTGKVHFEIKEKRVVVTQ